MGSIIPLRSEPKTSSRSLKSLQRLVADDLAEVNTLILERMGSRAPLVPELAGHIIAAGGKRMRPMLTIASSKLCGHTGKRHVILAACVEFIHTATLLHDDVVDESGLRRGNATANFLWGNQASVLVGDYLFTRAFQLMVEDGSLKVLDILANASAVIAEGEILQLSTNNEPETSEDAYLEVIGSKTAALFAAASRIGAVISNRSQAEEEALESHGRNLGIAFQLVDDALDYTAREETLGKAVGDDFREGKITLPTILAFWRGNTADREFWHRTLADRNQTENDLAHAISLLETTKALTDTIERARHYGAIARDALGIFPNGPIKDAMLEAVDFCIDRAH